MEQRQTVAKSLSENIDILNRLLPMKTSFDLMGRDVYLGNRKAYWVGLNGFCVTDDLEQIFTGLQYTDEGSDTEISDLRKFMAIKIGFVQLSYETDYDKILQSLTSGNSLLFVDGFDEAVVMDTRTYPSRGVEEPELEKMTRGARDGFNETLLTNANLIRRRVRSSQLVFEIHSVGKVGKTDVAITYLQDRCEPELVKGYLMH